MTKYQFENLLKEEIEAQDFDKDTSNRYASAIADMFPSLCFAQSERYLKSEIEDLIEALMKTMQKL